MGDNREALFKRTMSHAQDELHSFRTYLRWMCVDQSNIWTTCLSWFLFIVLGLLVPSLSHFYLACSTCDAKHARPYDWVVQLSLTSVSTTSFLCLTSFVKKYGLRRFLFFDKLCNESETVRKGYTAKLNRSLRLVSFFVLPCFLAETAYKVWWYASGASQIPFLGIVWLSDSVACFMELCSWLYRTTVFFLVCVLFHLVCNLQVLRLQDFGQVFQAKSDVGLVLSEHLRIRRQLRIISHRYRSFILWCLILVTGSQWTTLLITLKPNSEFNIYKAGELVMCSLTLLTGFCIQLRSATRITHKAQSVTRLASKCHVCATIDSFDVNDGETPRTPAVHGHQAFPHVGTDGESDSEDVADDEDELDNKKWVPAYAYNTISFQKRHALGKINIWFFLVVVITITFVRVSSSLACEFSLSLLCLSLTPMDFCLGILIDYCLFFLDRISLPCLESCLNPLLTWFFVRISPWFHNTSRLVSLKTLFQGHSMGTDQA